MKVLVRYETRYNKEGLSYLVHGKRVIQEVVAHYLSGKIKTRSGDVWTVKAVNHPDYQYITDEAVGG